MTLTESANEVLPGLWVGDANACAAAAGARFNRLCVLEDPCGVAGCEHQRILSAAGWRRAAGPARCRGEHH